MTKSPLLERSSPKDDGNWAFDYEPIAITLGEEIQLQSELKTDYSPKRESPEVQRLRTLLKIAERADCPATTTTTQEIVDLILDLGLRLQQMEFETPNEDVFEDPLQRSDSLGNVRMIHKHNPKSDPAFLRALGEQMCDLVHQFQIAVAEHSKIDPVSTEYSLEDFDWKVCVDLDVARRMISVLRKENLNFAIYESRWKQRAKKAQKALQRLTTGTRPRFEEISARTHRGPITCRKSHARQDTRPRKTEQGSSKISSQLDGISWT